MNRKDTVDINYTDAQNVCRFNPEFHLKKKKALIWHLINFKAIWEPPESSP